MTKETGFFTECGGYNEIFRKKTRFLGSHEQFVLANCYYPRFASLLFEE
jgi:hypothetical protein